MVLEEVMKVLADYKLESSFAATPKFEKALGIGIEALKRELAWRRRWPHQSHLPFPGETEE